MAAPQMRPTRRNAQPDDTGYAIAEDEEYYVTRPHTSVRRYRQPVERDTQDDYTPDEIAIQRRRASSMAVGNSITSKAVDKPAPRRRRRRAPWVLLIFCVLIMLGLIAGFNALGNWWQVHQDDVTYGTPRTYQLNAVVGHQDSTNNPSHFLFMNLNRRVVVVEFPGGDSTHAIIYPGPTLFGDNGNLIPVTATFKDVNGDHLPDMLLHIQDQTIVFINDGNKFRPLQPGEHVTL